MIWATTQSYIPIKNANVRSGGTFSPATPYSVIVIALAEPWDPMPDTQESARTVLQRAMSERGQCSFGPHSELCQHLFTTGFGILIFNENDTWWPDMASYYGGDAWVGILAVVQFELDQIMNYGMLDLAVLTELDVPPSAVEPYLLERVDDIAGIVSTRGYQVQA